MANFQESANVLKAVSHTDAPAPRKRPQEVLAAQDASQTRDAIHTVFAALDSPDDGDRDKKRRKTANGSAVSVQAAEIQQRKSVVLAKISLNLTLPTIPAAPADASLTSHLSQSSTRVSLELFDRIQQDTFRVVLYNDQTATGVEIIATASPDLLEAIAPHAHIATSLATTRDGKRIRPVYRAAFCCCTLAYAEQAQNEFQLHIEVRWTTGLSVVEHPHIKASTMKQDLKLLGNYFEDANNDHDSKWVLSDFYDAVHMPPADLEVSPLIQQSLVETSLYGFQQRAVDWLLRREGVGFSPTGELDPIIETAPPLSFVQTQDATGKHCHISRLRGMIVTNLGLDTNDTLQSLKGGILAEEMGLGKTVELIALVALHKRQLPTDDITDPYTGTKVKPSGATLIITPPSILQQWLSELNTHAPNLKVCYYKGLPPQSASKKDHEAATVEHLMQFDVVLTTYQVLSREIHHAKPPPDRASRHVKRHDRRNSPLVGISWWRVCLDEAQMVESGVSQAATVARIIPRCNAWAVTGTPLRKNVQDLRGLLVFLRCDSFANSKVVWDRLDKASFSAIFGRLALRHTKDRVRKELEIPVQKRVVITIPFTAIEEQHYLEMLRQMCNACWLTPDGIPTEEGRDVTHPEVVERMREWLVRLRQTCLHANVGRKNRKALGARDGALRTVHEVLEVMIDQNESNYKSEAREMIMAKMTLGHITAYAGDIKDRAQLALPYYEQALEDAQSHVAACRQELRLEQEKIGRLVSLSDEASTAEEDETESESLGRIPVIRKSLRSFLELEHACDFFIATTYHQIKDNEALTQLDSDDYVRLDNLESEWYEKAKVIRREILRHSKYRAAQQMSRVSKKVFEPVPKVKDLPSGGGIEARKILEMLDNMTDYLNAQADQIQVWRTKIVDILLVSLVDDEDKQEVTGDEYDDSLNAQDELYVYIMALRTLVADRNTAISGLQDALTEHELQAAAKQAKRSKPEEGDRGHAPELLLEIVEKRHKIQRTLEGGSLKGVIAEIRSVITRLQWRSQDDARALAETSILQQYLNKTQTIATEQAKFVHDLEKEQEMFRAVMNQRLEYYRQFQHVSDTVAKWKDELDEKFDKETFDKIAKEWLDRTERVEGLRAKWKYLTNLRALGETDEKPVCIICQETIEIGVLTSCGHKYCKECINQWWREHRSCPMCKQELRGSDFKDISFKPIEMKAREETQQSASPTQAPTPEPSTPSIYSDINDSTMKEIKMIDLDGSYGSKVDMIARHLLWIRQWDKGAKSVIFSQFGDFLDVLRDALRRWRIGASVISEKDGVARFKTDPAIECFLLDAKSESSGLTLVNAKYVFLCEPLINPAIELQAIARVHRIGQQQATTVFMYLVQDTVEEAIYDISVARRLEHISSKKNASQRSGTATPAEGLQENTLDAANSVELQSAPLKQLLRKKGDGEIVQEDDLWRCLFSKPRRPAKLGLEREVGRHLRAEAAEERADVASATGGVDADVQVSRAAGGGEVRDVPTRSFAGAF